MSMSVRLSVCLSARISETTRPKFTRFVAVSRSSRDGVAIRYVLPVFLHDVMFSHIGLRGGQCVFLRGDSETAEATA